MKSCANSVQLDQTGNKCLHHIWYGQNVTPQEGRGGVHRISEGCSSTDKGGNLILPIAA